VRPFPILERPYKGLAIFGAGASGREVTWLAREIWGSSLKVILVVDHESVPGKTVNDTPVVSLDDFARNPIDYMAVVALGDPCLRERWVSRLAPYSARYATLVHPSVSASSWVSIGEGSIVCAGSVLTTNIEIGSHVQINVGCTVSHDAKMEDFSTLSPGVHIAGWVKLGRSAFLGVGASVINGSQERPLTIGDRAIVGAGACVTQDVQADTTVVGVPARRMSPGSHPTRK
jgi:sugar O-acyltransferase (sialic acid O-acetyltransferase NeuD family)